MFVKSLKWPRGRLRLVEIFAQIVLAWNLQRSGSLLHWIHLQVQSSIEGGLLGYHLIIYKILMSGKFGPLKPSEMLTWIFLQIYSEWLWNNKRYRTELFYMKTNAIKLPTQYEVQKLLHIFSNSTVAWVKVVMILEYNIWCIGYRLVYWFFMAL